jgi:CO/xanthine dehydrogenase Mo-binding subunit
MAVGTSVLRKEAPNKLTGRARYNADLAVPGILHAAVATSPHAHARILHIDPTRSLEVPGVVAVVTADDVGGLLCGEVVEDRPPLAAGETRYWGEPVALVVADGEAEALLGVERLCVSYEPLPAVLTTREALRPGAPLVHENLGQYKRVQPPVTPKPGSNVADAAHIRKGDADRALEESAVTVTARYHLPPVDHAAMETRSARVEILDDGRVIIHATTQAPFEVQKLLARYMNTQQGLVIVNTPLVGGAFGGKAAVQLEVLAYLASRAAGGRVVEIRNRREQDLSMSPVGAGLDAEITLGADERGRLTGMKLTVYLDAGAYMDSTPRVARAICSESTGPYRLDHVHTDVYTVYTHHIYATAWRGFGHMPLTFVIERTMDKLADKLGIDALALRQQNALRPDDTTPTRVRLTKSRLGDIDRCLARAADLLGWDPIVRREGDGMVRAQGLAAFWKTSSSPPNAISGAIITLNQEGSLNLSTGTVEVGAGTKTTAAQILAERLQMPIDQIHVHSHINTKVDPEHWKTVASLSTFMVGRAVLEAAEDVIGQLKQVAAIALKCAPGDLEVAHQRVFLKDDPDTFVSFKDIAHGYSYPNGDAIGGQIIGRGSYVVRHITTLDENTGEGHPGPGFTIGVQGVELLYNPRDHQYRVLRAVTVLDAGRVINPTVARGVVMGGMNMGIGYGSREAVLFTADGAMANPDLRTYKVMRPGEQALSYQVEFVETPQLDAPYGARPVGEHGCLAIPAALANALSRAVGAECDDLPLTPERLWRLAGGREA